MKRIIISITCAAAAIASLASCEKFFDRQPEDKFAAELFFKSETDLRYYTNGLIDAALPSYDEIALGSDRFSDFCATKESTTFLQPDRYSAATAGGWTYSEWSFLRQVAYMLDNMPNAKGAVSEDVYNHYEGVARFFRAMITTKRVKKYGDVYWIDHVVSPNDSTILYGPRQDREYIMHKVVEDLCFACENCKTDGPNVRTGGCIYINRYTALALASRICLYEASYRRFHPVNPSTGNPWNGEYESSDDLYQLAMDFSAELVGSGVFSLHGNFRELFTSRVLPADEVIWGRSCSEDLSVGHKVTYKYCSTTSSLLYGPTKDYVMNFLDLGGNAVGGAVSPTEEFKNRDRRLAAQVLAPGQTKVDAAGNTVAFTPDFTWTSTGYFWMKWVMPEYSPMNEGGVDKSFNAMPAIRYAEVLLNYAEAAEAIGKLTPEIWNKTIAALRKEHGGISSAPFPAEPDPYLLEYYTKDVLHPASLSAAALEIRRERAVELTLEEGHRWDDLMRWNVGDILERRYRHQGWRGIYLSKEDVKNGFEFNGKKYTVSTTKTTNETNYKITTPDDKNHTLSHGDHGYLIYNYRLQWDDRMYLYPIPVTAANVNPNLGQNEGWQWI